jgi:hypothetical protein
MTLATPHLYVEGVGTSSTLSVTGGNGTATTLIVELPDDQSYFLTPAWQALVDRADADLVDGRVQVFATTEDLFADLDA